MNTAQISGVAESHRLNTQRDFKGSVSPPKPFVRVSLRVTCSLWDHVCYIVTFVYRCANIFTHSADGKSSQIPLAEKKRKRNHVWFTSTAGRFVSVEVFSCLL